MMFARCVRWILMIACILCFACKPVLPDKEVEKINPKLETSGLSFSKYQFIIGSDTLYTCEVPPDTIIELQFEGLKGFTEENGNVFIGASIMVTDSTDRVLFRNDDIFLDPDSIGYPADLVAKMVGISLVIDFPMVKKSTYYWKSEIWDKKGIGFIRINTKLILK